MVIDAEHLTRFVTEIFVRLQTDPADARRVAEQCGIPYYTLRMDDDFRRC